VELYHHSRMYLHGMHRDDFNFTVIYWIHFQDKKQICSVRQVRAVIKGRKDMTVWRNQQEIMGPRSRNLNKFRRKWEKCASERLGVILSSWKWRQIGLFEIAGDFCWTFLNVTSSLVLLFPIGSFTGCVIPAVSVPVPYLFPCHLLFYPDKFFHNVDIFLPD